MRFDSPRQAFVVATGLAAVSFALLLGTARAETAVADSPEAIARGLALATDHCAECHAIGLEGDSPYPPAPAWRDVLESRDIDEFGRAFQEGRLVHHEGPKQMPDFIFSPEQIADLLAYIKSLRQE